MAQQASLFLALVGAVLLGFAPTVQSQVIGDEAEMERLEARAEEAIANGDAETAALSMGRAALMASQLARRQEDTALVRLYLGAEELFRAQEQAYRALALFERAGGHPPASSGVCGTIRMAKLHGTESVELLEGARAGVSDAEHVREAERLQTLAAEWLITVDELRTDFQCPQ